LVRALVNEHRQSLGPIVIPEIGGQRGNPVLFDRSTFPDLKTLSGDSGGRALFAHYPTRCILWLDDQVNLDIDTPEDYSRLLEEDV
jgi:molybdenum cofactor cytidylyltransferase